MPNFTDVWSCETHLLKNFVVGKLQRQEVDDNRQNSANQQEIEHAVVHAPTLEELSRSNEAPEDCIGSISAGQRAEKLDSSEYSAGRRTWQ